MAFEIIKIAYVYEEPETWARFTLACNSGGGAENQGWPKSIMLTQVAHTFGATQLEYYQEAAKIDAAARGFKSDQGEYYQLLKSWSELPPYKSVRPDFQPSLLSSMPDPDQKLPRQSFSKFRCSGRNSAILYLATIIERSNVQVAMTKLLRWYYTNYWGRIYTMQIASDEQETLSPELSK